jgi:hypothetical protein
MFGDVVGGDEGHDMSLEAFQIVVVQTLIVASLIVRFIRSAWPLVHG